MLVLKNISILFLALQFAGSSGCQKKSVAVNGNDPGTVVPPSEVSFWLTKSDQSVLLQQQAAPIYFGTQSNTYPSIEVDSTQRFQSIDGFGYNLTGGSARNSIDIFFRTNMRKSSRVHGFTSSRVHGFTRQFEEFRPDCF